MPRTLAIAGSTWPRKTSLKLSLRSTRPPLPWAAAGTVARGGLRGIGAPTGFMLLTRNYLLCPQRRRVIELLGPRRTPNRRGEIDPSEGEPHPLRAGVRPQEGFGETRWPVERTL